MGLSCPYTMTGYSGCVGGSVTMTSKTLFRASPKLGRECPATNRGLVLLRAITYMISLGRRVGCDHFGGYGGTVFKQISNPFLPAFCLLALQ